MIGPDPTLKMGQLAVPPEIAKNLTIPVQVTNFNYDYCTKLVNDGKVNYVLKDKGVTRINLENALFFKGTRVAHGDIIVRKDKTGKEFEFLVTNGKELLKPGDKLKRNGEWIKDLKYPEKRSYKLNVGDIVERQLQDGDSKLLLFFILLFKFYQTNLFTTYSCTFEQTTCELPCIFLFFITDYFNHVFTLDPS